MLYQKILKVFGAALFSLSIKERLFILAIFAADFFICADYALVRPVSNSLFIHAYGSAALPYAWLAMVPVNFLITALYNRLLSRYSTFAILAFIVGSVILINSTCALFFQHWKPLSFIFFIWKEIYILLFFQQLWALVHTTVSLQHAKYLYGFIYGVGAIGGVFGALIPAFFAVQLGSESILFFTTPYVLLLLFFYYIALKYSKVSSLEPVSHGDGIKEGIMQIARSRFLLYILLIVLFMQTASTLIDYQFHVELERFFPEKDLRTEFSGKVFSMVNIITLCTQLGGGLLLMRFLGLRKIHFLSPLLLGANALASLFFPFFGVVTYSFVMAKSFDFSIFGMIKEILYIPLSQEEKFHAKSLIDVFVYRSAKAIAAAVIFLFQWLFPGSLFFSLTLLLTGIFFLWFLSVVPIYKKELLLFEKPESDLAPEVR